VPEKPSASIEIATQSGKAASAHYSSLSKEDRNEIVSQPGNSSVIEAGLPAEQRPDLDRELTDQFTASTIGIKFVAFKTNAASAPKRMYFTLKFYNLKEIKTEQTLLRLPLNVAKSMRQQATIQENEADSKLLANRQYFLMKVKSVKAQVTGSLLSKTQLDEEYAGLENGMQVQFDFDPSTMSHQSCTEKEQHRLFCSFLMDRAVTIDIWDGDTLMHFAACRIPLFLFMRQGEPLRICG